MGNLIARRQRDRSRNNSMLEFHLPRPWPSPSVLSSSSSSSSSSLLVSRKLRRSLVGSEGSDADPSIDCSFEISNDYESRCSFPRRYGLCELSETTEHTISNLEFTTPRDFQQILVPFNYELYFGGNLTEPPLDFLQGSMLEQLARKWGLEDCTTTNGRRHRRSLQETSNELLSLVAMTSDPSDVVDNQGPCQAPVEKSIQETAACHKIKGQMTVALERNVTMIDTNTNSNTNSNGNNIGDNHMVQAQLAIISQVLRDVRSLMQENRLVVETEDGSIDKVIFMGERDQQTALWNRGDTGNNEEDPFQPHESMSGRMDDSKDDNATSLSGIGIGFLVLLGLGLIFCCAVVWTTRQRQRRKQRCQQRSTEMDNNDVHENDVEDPKDGSAKRQQEVMESTLPHPDSTSSSSNGSNINNNNHDQDIVHDNQEYPEVEDGPESMLVTFSSSDHVELDGINNNNDGTVPVGGSTNDDDPLSLSQRTDTDRIQDNYSPNKSAENQNIPPDSPNSRTLADMSEPSPVSSWEDEEDLNNESVVVTWQNPQNA